jgi:gas vesicle protein
MSDKKNKSTFDKLILGAIIGAAVGSVIGASVAPDDGKTTRSKLSSKIENNLIIFENISFGLSRLEQSKMAIFLQKLSLNNTVVVIDQSEILKEASSNQIKY